MDNDGCLKSMLAICVNFSPRICKLANSNVPLLIQMTQMFDRNLMYVYEFYFWMHDFFANSFQWFTSKFIFIFLAPQKGCHPPIGH